MVSHIENLENNDLILRNLLTASNQQKSHTSGGDNAGSQSDTSQPIAKESSKAVDSETKQIHNLSARFCIMNEIFFQKLSMPTQIGFLIKHTPELLNELVTDFEQFDNKTARALALKAELYLAVPPELHDQMERDPQFRTDVCIPLILFIISY